MVHSWSPDKFGILCLAHPPMDTIQITVEPDPTAPKIQVLQPCEGTHYLGLYINQLCTMRPMEKHIWQKALVYTKAFQQTHMSHHEASVLYCSCFLPALSYPLLAVWLLLAFLDRIHLLSTPIILNKMDSTATSPTVLSLHHDVWVASISLCNLSHE